MPALHSPSTNLCTENGQDLGEDARWADLGDLELTATMEQRVNDRGTPEWRVVGALKLERGMIRIETGAYFREAWARVVESA